jgi:hypothetical protein
LRVTAARRTTAIAVTIAALALVAAWATAAGHPRHEPPGGGVGYRRE